MPIKPIKKVRGVKYSAIESDDYMQRPHIKAPLKQSYEDQSLGYSNRRLYMDGKEVGSYIREVNQNNPQLLAKIANELEKFRKNAAKRKKKRFFWSKAAVREFSDDDLGVIFSLCDAYIQRISELIKQRYDQTKDGLSVTFDEEGQLILNNMNIHAFIENCRQNPTEKSLIFLKGIKIRLNRVLDNKIGSRNYDRIQDVVGELIFKIDNLLNKQSKE